MPEEKKVATYYEPIEPDWEQPIYDAAKETFRRLYSLNTGCDLPDDEIVSPAAVSIIEHEIRKIVNKLTEHWY